MRARNPSPSRTWVLRSCAALLALFMSMGMASQAHAGVFISVGFAPPPLPIYAQPMIPGPGYIWTPGYWAYADDGGYYWVPGTWVIAPFYGALWTPGYWGWAGGVYVLHRGYWGSRVGFYGGINYGYGYTGMGYAGGYWRAGGFYYNQSVNRIGGNVTTVYNRTVVNNVTVNRISFNGGRGGIAARPTAQQAAFAHEQHTAPVAAQQRQLAMASHNPSLRASFNHGSPPIAATPRAGAFSGPGVVHAEPAHFVRHGSASTPPNEAYRGYPRYRAQGSASRSTYGRQAEAGRSSYTPQAEAYRPQSRMRPLPHRPIHASARKNARPGHPPARHEKQRH